MAIICKKKRKKKKNRPCYTAKQKKRLHKEMQRIRPIPAKEFLSLWDALRTEDVPGCYMITVYEKKPKRRHVEICSGYDHIYIGQSITVYHRVHNHLTGHGNGDVYADRKYGNWVYVRIRPCDKMRLNDTEKMLIEIYDATKSYNKTVGGAKIS